MQAPSCFVGAGSRAFPITQLPSELVEQVTIHLNRDEIGRLRLTCKSLAAACISPLAKRFGEAREISLDSPWTNHATVRRLFNVSRHPKFAAALRKLHIRTGSSCVPMDHSAASVLRHTLASLQNLGLVTVHDMSAWVTCLRGPDCTNLPLVSDQIASLVRALQFRNAPLRSLTILCDYRGCDCDKRQATRNGHPLHRMPHLDRLQHLRICINSFWDAEGTYDHITRFMEKATNVKDLYVSMPSATGAKVLPAPPMASLTTFELSHTRVSCSDLHAFLKRNSGIKSLHFDSAHLVGGSWQEILRCVRNELVALSTISFVYNKTGDRRGAYTLWDGRPLIIFQSAPVVEGPLCGGEYQVVMVSSADSGSMFPEMIEEKGIRQALDDFISGYCEI